mmetsp:Transcript_25743/g.64857  ORF Transcript_25743/g.64857 Transcript_25743/m.64857 type:complete len:206 (+) Transcript_25743:2904-3521(+)
MRSARTFAFLNVGGGEDEDNSIGREHSCCVCVVECFRESRGRRPGDYTAQENRQDTRFREQYLSRCGVISRWRGQGSVCSVESEAGNFFTALAERSGSDGCGTGTAEFKDKQSVGWNVGAVRTEKQLPAPGPPALRRHGWERSRAREDFRSRRTREERQNAEDGSVRGLQDAFPTHAGNVRRCGGRHPRRFSGGSRRRELLSVRN